MADDNKIADIIIGSDDLDTETRRYVSDSEGYSPSSKQLICFDEDGDLVLPRRISQYRISCYYYFYGFLQYQRRVPKFLMLVAFLY